MIGLALAWCVAAGLVVVGLASLPLARPMSAAYGAPVDAPEPVALVRAMGLRDLALGIALAAPLLHGDRHGAAVVLGATALLSIADLAVVAALHGKVVPQLLGHAAGFVVCLAGALLLATSG